MLVEVSIIFIMLYLNVETEDKVKVGGLSIVTRDQGVLLVTTNGDNRAGLSMTLRSSLQDPCLIRSLRFSKF